LRNPFDERLDHRGREPRRAVRGEISPIDEGGEAMNHQQRAGVSRRSIVKGGVYALAGIAIASLTRTGTSAAETKLAKAAVQYVDAGKEEGKDCDDCIQFIPGKTPKAMGTCKIVEGDINPHGHCIAFTPKPKR